MEACCDPYFNELSRGERGSRPRMYFAGDDFDNDYLQGLLHLLGAGRLAHRVDDRWAIVVASPDAYAPQTAVAFRQLLASLRSTCGNDERIVADLVLPVVGATSPLREAVLAMGCTEDFLVSDSAARSFNVLSPAGLLPAAILGLNVVQLLEGAQSLNEHFRAALPGENVVLDFAGVCHLLELRRQATLRRLCIWSRALDGVGRWYQALLTKRLGGKGQGGAALTVVNSRNIGAIAPRFRAGQPAMQVVNWTVERCRCDPLPVGHSALDRENPSDPADRTIPQLMAAAANEAMQADRQAGDPASRFSCRRPPSSGWGSCSKC